MEGNSDSSSSCAMYKERIKELKQGPKLEHQNEVDYPLGSENPKLQQGDKKTSEDSAIDVMSPKILEEGCQTPNLTISIEGKLRKDQFSRQDHWDEDVEATGTDQMGDSELENQNDRASSPFQAPHFDECSSPPMQADNGASGFCEPSSPSAVAVSLFSGVVKEMLRERQLRSELIEHHKATEILIMNLKEQLFVSNANNSNLEGQVKQLEDQQNILRSSLVQITQQADHLDEQCQELRLVEERTRQRVTVLSNENQQLRRQVNESSERCQRIVQTLEDERRRFQRDFDAQKQKNEKQVCILNVKVDQLNERIAILENEIRHRNRSQVVSEGVADELSVHQGNRTDGASNDD